MNLSEDLSEVIGIIFGDGNIWTNYRKYEITITVGENDSEYFGKICQMLKLKNFKVYERKRGRGLRATIYSKDLFAFLVWDLNIGWGREKSQSDIPQEILGKRSYALRFVRGVFDTDGSIFTSEKKGVESYPSLEITNKNSRMLETIREVLEIEGFRTTFNCCRDGTKRIGMNGKKNVKRWYSIVGSTHPRKKAKMEAIIKTYS